MDDNLQIQHISQLNFQSTAISFFFMVFPSSLGIFIFSSLGLISIFVTSSFFFIFILVTIHVVLLFHFKVYNIIKLHF